LALLRPVPGRHDNRLRCAGDVLHLALRDLLPIHVRKQFLTGRGDEQMAVFISGVHVLRLQILSRLLGQQWDGCTAIAPVLSSGDQ
jgi:hypothetical protein